MQRKSHYGKFKNSKVKRVPKGLVKESLSLAFVLTLISIYVLEYHSKTSLVYLTGFLGLQIVYEIILSKISKSIPRKKKRRQDYNKYYY